jgi:hypothetical protein
MKQLQPVLGSAGAAELLHELLGQRGVGMAEDSEGMSTRGRAVETLLGLGHPWGLTVTPEDLRWYRGEGRRLRAGGMFLVGLPLLSSLVQAWSFGARLWQSPGVDAAAGLALALGTAAFAGLSLLRPPRLRSGRRAHLGLLVAGVGGGLVAAFGEHTGLAWVTAVVTVPVALWLLFQADAA